ncbi:nucleoside-diphosphate-sugar epimerase [Actinomycetospora succinea]|uniref:Nucleoside-diphosphate-sugar epimerase n=1 Tax=Actinomycetospora succinea TaxID=663603 RepID=A0A4R6UJ83_9PSEU|nr:SDR family oxidoreductase [Actinomycetospora succinea]TDQ46978.1 nucleoside-diphosphate-sugar epimerase [Actinomycetospora succinea]
MSPLDRPLVVGVTGISGHALAERLAPQTGQTLGLSRGSTSPVPGVEPLHADLTDPEALRETLAGTKATSVFLTAWSRQETEEDNIRVNGALVRDVLDAACADGTVEHVALVTGLKHYLGPFEAYGQGELPETPFTEDTPRLDAPNFYYAQEDELVAAAERHGFGWSVHRAHTMIGFAVGNAMNIGSTLAASAAICRETGRPFRFPGSAQQWHGLTDMTDAGQLADQMVWAATTPGARNEPFNIVDGDVFRWRWMWPRLAELLHVTPEGFDGEPAPLEQQMEGMAPVWERIAEREGLRESQLDRVASFWHTDGDLGRDIECVTDMTKSRLAGFTGYTRTLDAFARVFDRLRDERVVPS